MARALICFVGLLLMAPLGSASFVAFEDPPGDVVTVPGGGAAHGTGDYVDITSVLTSFENGTLQTRINFVSFLFKNATAVDLGSDFFVVSDMDLLQANATHHYRLRLDCIPLNGVTSGSSGSNGCRAGLYERAGSGARLIQEIPWSIQYGPPRVKMDCRISWCNGAGGMLTNFSVGAYYTSSSGVSWLDNAEQRAAFLTFSEPQYAKTGNTSASLTRSNQNTTRVPNHQAAWPSNASMAVIVALAILGRRRRFAEE